MKANTTLILLIIGVLTSFSCKTFYLGENDEKIVFITNDHATPLLNTDEYKESKIIYQIITGEHSGNKYSMQTVLSLNPDELSVTAMTPIGNTIYDLTYNKNGINYNALIDSGGETSLYMIFDIQLCYYPQNIIADAIKNTGLIFLFTEVENGWIREVYNGNELILRITRSDNTIKYNNNLRNYSYVIEEVL